MKITIEKDKKTVTVISDEYHLDQIVEDVKNMLVILGWDIKTINERFGNYEPKISEYDRDRNKPLNIVKSSSEEFKKNNF